MTTPAHQNQAEIQRDTYGVLYPITTRWSDNDIYGHVNNVTYYAYFDSAVNRFLIEQGGLDIHHGEIVGFVVNSHCNYLAPIAYPDDIEVGIKVNKLGNSSVTYGVAIFKAGQTQAVAYGHFVHVFVDKQSSKPTPIPDELRAALAKLVN